MPSPLSERKLVFLIGSGQFINMVDFMMVAPIGPDITKALGIPVSNIGFVSSSYTAAAALAGIAGAFFLDRFDRRRALAVALAGLAVGTAAGGLATDFGTLLAARVIAGAFGGPATALALAIVSDMVAPERLGRAMGAVMASSALAAVLGVPAGLELASLGGWRAPFFTVAALGAVVSVAAMSMLPPQRAHLSAGPRAAPPPFRDVLIRPVVQLALASTAAGAIANFALIPNISAYLQFNRDCPRDDLSLLYSIGGALSFGATRLAGRLTDRLGAPPLMTGGAIAYAVVLLFGFIYPIDEIHPLAILAGFMVPQGFRFVPMQVLSSQIPEFRERARFMSAQSAVLSTSQAIGGIVGAQLLSELPDGSLAGIDDVAWFAFAMAFVHTAMSYTIDRRVHARAA